MATRDYGAARDANAGSTEEAGEGSRIVEIRGDRRARELTRFRTRASDDEDARGMGDRGRRRGKEGTGERED